MTCFQKVRSHCLEIPRAINYKYILGMRWIAHLAFVRCVNRRERAIARLLLTGLHHHHISSAASSIPIIIFILISSLIIYINHYHHYNDYLSEKLTFLLCVQVLNNNISHVVSEGISMNTIRIMGI